MNRASFFDCKFVWSPRELPGGEPYVIFEDDRSEPFAAPMIRAARGEEGFRGVICSPSEVPDAQTIVICEAPVWHRNCDALNAAGVSGDRALAMLYFDVDPSGFWDFAKGCGKGLSEIFHDGGVDASSIEYVADFLETWTGSRVSNGRIVPLSRFYTRDFYPLHEEAGASIARVMAAMADDESRAAYARILFGTAEQVFTAFSNVAFGDQQYMEIVHPTPGDVIINCGVGRGWEIPYFLCRMKGEGHIHNIDPNMQFASTPYEGLIKEFSDIQTDHMIIAGDQDGTMTLAMTDGGMVVSDSTRDTNAADDERTVYQVSKIDTLMSEGLANRMDYLKMDVEGGERSILRGAIGSIQKYRPKLAIAIYHEPHHFWEYPCYLLDHLEDYRFYLRQYGYSRFETLLYAVPAEATISGSGSERLRRAPRTRDLQEHSTAPLVLAYFHDKPGAERDFYAGQRRGLARLFGRDWETAEIAPAPQMDASTICGVLERGDEKIIVTRHEIEPGRASVIVGRSTSPTTVEWVASVGLGLEAICTIMESDEVRIAVHDPEVGAASIFRLDGDLMSHERDLLLNGKMLAAWDEGAMLHFICQDEVQGLMHGVLQTGETEASWTPMGPIHGEFAGLVAIKRNREAGGVFSRGYAVRAGDVMKIFEPNQEGMTHVVDLQWDHRFLLIPTSVRK